MTSQTSACMGPPCGLDREQRRRIRKSNLQRRFKQHQAAVFVRRGACMLIGTCITVAMLFANLAMPHRMRLIGVGLLLVPQIYIPGFPVSLAVVWTVMTCVAGVTMD